MARGLTKEVEGIIAIVIFVLFIVFYFSMLNLGIFNRIRLYQDIYTKNSLADSIFNSLQREGYIVTLNVTIPKYSKEFACNLSDNKLRYDFCERFPIFYPLNISYLTNQRGVLNNTNDTLLDPNVGMFFYANFSEFYCEEDKGYLIVNIYNPFNQDLNNIYVLLMSPTIYNWLKNSFIKLNTSYTYCYLNKSGYCTNTTENSIGIVINIASIKGNSSIYLNISKSNENNAIYLGKLSNDFNLTSLPYKIVYEPLCYKEYNFVISDKVNYNFSKYNDLLCYINIQNNYLSFNPLYHKLSYFIYENYYNKMTLTNESSNPINKNYNISCISNFNSPFGEVNYVVFSNTSWFIASLGKNTDYFVNLIYWKTNGEINFDRYFYLYEYYNFSNPNNISYFNTLFKSHPYYGFFLLPSAPIISYYQVFSYKRFNISYYPKEDENKVFAYFYLTISTDSELPRSIYYQFKIPNIKLSKITKALYIYPEDLINQNITFSIKNLNINYGNLEDKGFSKTYYSYVFYNNTLIKDYITIYLK